MNQKKKKSKGSFIALFSIISIFIAAVIFFILFFFTTLFLNPKQKVTLAFSKALGADNIISFIFGNNNCKSSGNLIPYYGPAVTDYLKFISNLADNNFQQSYYIKLEDYESEDYSNYKKIKGSSIKNDFAIDYNNRLAYCNINFKFLALKILDADIYLDDENLSFAFNNFSDAYFTFNTEEFGEDFVNSDFATLLEDDIEFDENIKNLSFNFFDYLESLKNNNISLFSILKEHQDKASDIFLSCKEFYDDIEVSKTGAVDYFYLGDNKIDCTEYKIKIDEKTVKHLVNAYEDYFKETICGYYDSYFDNCKISNNILDSEINQIKDNFYKKLDSLLDDFNETFNEAFIKDYIFYVYLDNKCRLIDIFYPDSFEIGENNYDILLDLSWHGEEYLVDDFEGKLIISNNEEEIDLVFTNEGTSSKNSRKDLFSCQIINPDDPDDLNYNIEIEKNSSKDGNFSKKSLFKNSLNDNYLKIYSEGQKQVDDNSLFINYDEISFDSNLNGDNLYIEFSSAFDIKFLEEDVPTASGKRYEILKMDYDELYDLHDEIEEKIDSLF